MSVFVVAMACSIAAGEVIYVDDDAPDDPGPGDPCVSDLLEDGTAGHPFDAIQEAIDVAIDGDTIIVLSGTYTGTGNRDIDFNDLAITVRSTDPEDPCVVVATIVDCNSDPNNSHRGFYFHNGEDGNSVLAGITITNGYAGYGGGIHCTSSSPTISNCTFSKNMEAGAGCGGGMFNYNSNPTVTNCTFRGNSSFCGGGMGNYTSSPTLTNCSFSDNSAKYGGGMYNCDSSSPKVTNCTFRGNSAIHYRAYHGGGGMYNTNSSPTVTNCAFIGNIASHGGGMLNVSSSSIVTSCTFSGNFASGNLSFKPYGDGGGMYNYNSSLTVTNCILWGNMASDGKDIFLRNSSTIDVNYCDVKGGEADIYDDGSGNNIIWGSNIDADPCFVELGYWDPNGTPSDTDDDFWIKGDYHLRPDSPCINAGDNNSLPPDTADLDGDSNTTEPIPWDLDGNPRIFNGIVDMGAFERGVCGGPGRPYPPGDVNQDCEVNFLDIAVIANNWLARS